MTDRERLANDIYDILLVHGCMNDEVRQRIVIAMDQYEIQKRTTDIVVADPNDNANVIRRFMVAKKVSGRSDKTIAQYVGALRKFITVTGKQLLDVTPDDFRAYLAHRMIEGRVKSVTLSNERCFISAFYDWAVASELILRNPIKQVDPVKVAKVPKKAFTEMELEKIRAACRNLREKALVETFLSTACRVSEVAGIRTVDIDGSRIMVCGKGNKIAQVYLSSKAQYAVEAYIESRTDNNPYLFPGRRKNQPCTDASIQRILKTIGSRAGVENVHPHRFRRTAATFALRRGMSLEMVSRMLRHERLQTTMIYLDLDERELMYQHQKYVG